MSNIAIVKESDFQIKVVENGLVLTVGGGDYSRVPAKAWIFESAAQMTEFLDGKVNELKETRANNHAND